MSLALGAEATFVARSIDRDRKHLTSVLRAAAEHRGTALVEIYQNCNIFNDDAFEPLKDPATRDDFTIRLEHGEPIRWGADLQYGVVRVRGRVAEGGRRRPTSTRTRSSSTTRTTPTRRTRSTSPGWPSSRWPAPRSASSAPSNDRSTTT